MFSNSPSPVVAIYSLRKAAEEGENEFDSDFKQFVLWNFYVDNALTSVPSNEEAMDLLKRTKKMLEQSQIKLHKIASNINSVMKAFPSEEQAKDPKDLNLSVDPLPLQRSLGLVWNLERESFTLCVPSEEKPFTKRSILSTVNNLYDPLGFAAPVTL